MRIQIFAGGVVVLVLVAVLFFSSPVITGRFVDAPTERVVVILKPEQGNLITGAFSSDEPSIREMQAETAEVQEQVLSDVNSPGVLPSILGAEQVNDVEAERTLDTLPAMIVDATPEGIEKLKEHPLVEAVYPDFAFELSLADSAPIVNADDANAINIAGTYLKGAGMAACVIDTGIQASHPAFGSRVIAQKCYCSPSCCANGQAEDSVATDVNSVSHGTHVSGIIAADGSVKGIAPEANIVAVKVCGSVCQLSDIISGLDFCYTNKDLYNIKVVSGSLGDGGNYQTQSQCPTFFDSAIDALYASNIASVFASGNNGYSSGVSYPACSPNAIAVGASDKTDHIASFTNRGPLLELVAPGVSITSAKATDTYGALSGTSQATPHVSGAVLLLQQYSFLTGQSFTVDQIKQALVSPGFMISTDYPRLDITESLDYLGFTSTNSSNLSINITSPMENATEYENGTMLSAVVSGNSSNVTIEWSSNVSGVLGFGENLSVNLTAGAHLIFANASEGNSSVSANVSVIVLAANSSNSSNLSVAIVSPVDGSTLYSNGTVLLASISGNSSPLTPVWSSNLSGSLAAGNNVSVNLSAGVHIISVSVVDGNLTANFSSVVTVIAPLSVSILAPANDSVLLTNGTNLLANATENSTISWFSNTSGSLGAGNNITVNLSAGVQVITATASLNGSSVNSSVFVDVMTAACVLDIDLNANNDTDVGDVILLLTSYTSNSTGCTTPTNSGACVINVDRDENNLFDLGDIVLLLRQIISNTLYDIFDAQC